MIDQISLPPDEPQYRPTVLIRRLITEQGLVHWRKYAFAFVLMGVAAAATALSAYLIGNVINEAYINKNFPGIVLLGGVTAALFITKGLATYGHSVMLSRIGNRIVADNQRAVFAKLLNEGLGFYSDRHSTEFITRLTTGAAAATQVINLLVSSVGRDVLTLIGLVAVMVMQDPVMSFFSFVVAPPALLVLRKLIRRIYVIARTQFHGNTRVVETLQETLQGIRIVKAFTLEDIMRERFDRNVAAVEHETNKMARVSSRASPLMESLGGCAIAMVLIYAGYRVIETGATAGQFFSFITAFLLAYEPAKRLARLNIELNGALVGVRILFEVLEFTADRTGRRRQAGARNQDAAARLRGRALCLPGRRRGAARHEFRRRGRQADRAGRAVRRRQVDRLQSDPALLRVRTRQNRYRRTEHHAGLAPVLAPARRVRRAGRLPVPRLDPRQHRLRQAGRERGRDRRRRQGRLCARFHHVVPTRLRDAGGRARPAALGRPAPAHRDRARAHQERADHSARRGDRRARIPNPNCRCARRWSICAAAAPRSPSRTGCTRYRTPTAST